ncbi:HAMP domain-containing histidine kinase [bacterium]|nr:HAMP domain-containing histidine kinase [bacterium]
MIDKRAYVLPVFKNGVFIGILSVDQIAGTMNKFTERLSARLIRNEHQLKVTKEKAVIAENLKTAILENISHEIRTPMNGLLGFSYLLASEGITDEKRLSYIEHIEESCKKLTNVIDNIIEISCIQAGDNHIVDHEECTAGDILRELHIYYDHEKKKLDKNQIEFICKYPIENNSSIKCDPKRLKEILSYLIDNAFKFTEKGFVEIGAHIKNTLVFYVKDTGIGISAENQNAIFNAFSKIVEEKGPILYPGLGLGLTIAKRLIELMGGSITVESEYTKGSVFYVTMPLLENSV